MTAFREAMEGLGWAAWWRLDESSGTTVHDSAGTNTGTYLNAPTLGVAAKLYAETDTAIALAASKKQGIEVPSASALDVGDKFSLHVRVQLNKATEETNRTLFSKNTKGYELRIEEDGKVALLKQNVIAIAYSSLPLKADGKVHNIVATKNGSAAHIYVDGIDVTLPAHEATIENTASELLLGMANPSGLEAADFAIFDEPAVANYALSLAQVEALQEATTGPPPALIFDGDTRAVFELEGSIQEAEANRITEVKDPSGETNDTVFKFAVKNTDLLGGENPRAQMLSPQAIPPGLDFWVNFAFYLPASFPTTGIEWIQVMETPYGPPFGGPAPFSIKIANVAGAPAQMIWQRNGSYSYDIPWAVPLVKESWIDVLAHVKFGGEGEGFVEMWVNGSHIIFFPEGSAHNPNKVAPTKKLVMATRDASNNEAPNMGILQNYRLKGTFEEVTVYLKPLLLGRTRASVEPEGEVRRLRVREYPPMRQYILATTPGGKTYRWGEDERSADSVIEGLTDSDTVPGGYRELTGELARKPGVSYGDMTRGTLIEVFGAGGYKVSEYRLERAPRTAGDKLVMDPAAGGFQTHLTDEENAIGIFIDSDLGSWGETSAERKATQTSEKINIDGQVSVLPAGTPVTEHPTESSVVPAISHAFANLNNNEGKEADTAESWYESQVELGRIMLDFVAVKGLGGWTDQIYTSVDGVSLKEELHNYAGTSSTEHLNAEIAAERFFLMLRDYYAPSFGGVTNSEAHWQNIKVQDRSGLSLYGEWPNVGVLASDVIAYALQRWAPLINFTTGANGSIRPTSFPIPQLAFKEPTTVQEMVTQALRYELLEWGIWNDQTFYLNPRGEREGRKIWRGRVRPTQFQEAGLQLDKVFNGVIIQAQDPNGTTLLIGPPGSGLRATDERLLDNDPENPVNQIPGLKRWKKVTLKGVSTLKGMVEAGEQELARVKELEGSGSATLTGYVESSTGGLYPYYCVHSGDLFEPIDASDPSPRYIIQATRSRSSRSVQIELDQPPDTQEQSEARKEAALAELGFT